MVMDVMVIPQLYQLYHHPDDYYNHHIDSSQYNSNLVVIAHLTYLAVLQSSHILILGMRMNALVLKYL